MNWRTPLSGLAGPLAAAALTATVAPAAADGTFVQIDLSRDTSSAVATVTRGRLSYGALHSEYEGGASTRVNVLYSVPLEDGVTLRVGPSLGVTERDGRGRDDPELGAKATLDRYAVTSFGALYLLGEYDTIDHTWFLLAQASFGPSGVSVELSTGASDAYEDTTLAISKRLREGPVSLRGGWRIQSEEAFLGFSINTF